MLRRIAPKTWAGRRTYKQVEVRTRAPQAPDDIDVSEQREHERYLGVAEHALRTYDEACQEMTWVNHT